MYTGIHWEDVLLAVLKHPFHSKHVFSITQKNLKYLKSSVVSLSVKLLSALLINLLILVNNKFLY